MKKSMLMLAALAAGSLYAQQPTTEAAVLKQAYAAIKGNVTKAAEKMPEDQYGFKASPDIRTFGGLIGHIADVQGRICAAAAGSTPPASAGEKTAKADLVAALNASFAVCDGVFDSLTDADASEDDEHGPRRSSIGISRHCGSSSSATAMKNTVTWPCTCASKAWSRPPARDAAANLTAL